MKTFSKLLLEKRHLNTHPLNSRQRRKLRKLHNGTPKHNCSKARAGRGNPRWPATCDTNPSPVRHISIAEYLARKSN